MKKKLLWITQTAVLTALLVVVQSLTKAGGQFVTGSCVNAVLAVAVLVAGLWSGVSVALISPFLAFLLGIGPQLIAIVPAIALGNVVFVLVLSWLNRKKVPFWQQALTWAAAATAKFLTLYLVVVQLLCRVLPLKEQQVVTFSAMFSWPQLVTALIGGGAALLVSPIIRKALRK